VPALTDGLQDPRPSVRVKAAQALPEFGVGALPALPALSNLLNDPSPPVRQAAGHAIARLNEAAKSAAAR
jgi:HEAT repeat protein